MSFRFLPKSVTLSDLEWRNDLYFAFLLPNFVVSGAHCVNVVYKAITRDNLRLKYSITADWKLCSRFINSRFNAQYLPSYRLIC